jgi:hypothetical protein
MISMSPERQTDRQTGGQIGRQVGRETDREQADRQAGIQTDRQALYHCANQTSIANENKKYVKMF